MAKEEKKIVDENEIKEEAKEIRKKSKGKTIFAIIFDLLALALLLFVIFETVIGFLGFNDVREDKTPGYYIDIKEETTGSTTKTIYNFGLYKAIKTEDSKTYSYKLVPFFLD